MAEDEIIDEEPTETSGEIDLGDELDLGDDFEEKDALDLQFGGQAEAE